MAYDLEEQEQLDEFKAWWKKSGKLISNLILVVLLAYAGWQGYHYFQAKKSVEASTLYQTLVTTDTSKLADIQAQATKLTADYAGTPYAGRAAIYAAKVNIAANDHKNAKTQLEWAAKNAKESTTKAIASLQLAGILFEEKSYDAALKLLSSDSDKGFVGLKEDLKGDIYMAQGKKTEAKKAYETALIELDSQGRLSQYTRQKLESLGV
ncbi:YfgM family protein [Methylotenera versatilis]|uniref:YfgM family protein n=1 Tax=Methylotenera versatilis TaxID=1055487 RepID=UPI000647097C|nr:tetratricopeptide repeat protein [Methylotenera versatilis]